ncbi:4,5-dihydroxyphthalate decarboxylase [Rhizobiales bacterium GAS188]|nr:4,5-dihydroxyphthalate decarboxylase [Rhizobiales bacterium GAS188]
MSNLNLSIAIGDYDRMRPFVDGAVRMDGVDPVFMLLEPEEIFFRAFRHAEFDICELSLSSYTVKISQDDCPYVAVPVFPSRAFRHTSIFIRDDRGIERPADLKGKRIGVPEYQLTANVWARMILETEYGVHPREITWVQGGYETPGRVEKIKIDLPADIRVEAAPADATLSGMLADGRLDGIIGPRAPSCFEHGHANVKWLFADPTAAAADWYERTKIFPIMHVLGIRRTLLEAHPFLAAAALKVFTRSKAVALAKLADTSATKVTLPFVEEQLRRTRALMGDDFWAYGFQPNRVTLEAFLKAHHSQGLSKRLMQPEELFHPSTLEAHKI